MKLDIPFYSQHDSNVPEEWRHRACGVVSLRMALESKTGKVFEPKILIEKGVEEGAYIQGVGWKHDGLVRLANENGCEAYRKEFSDSAEGIEYLKQVFDKGEIPIVSVRFVDSKDSHLITLCGYTDEGFFYNDSAKMNETDGKGAFIKTEEFVQIWRKLAIFVG